MVTYTDNAGVVTAYKYDALGRRIEKNVGGTITQFLYDGSRVIEELDVDGTLDASYVYGRYIDGSDPNESRWNRVLLPHRRHV
jgi:hypothetical protein